MAVTGGRCRGRARLPRTGGCEEAPSDPYVCVALRAQLKQRPYVSRLTAPVEWGPVPPARFRSWTARGPPYGRHRGRALQGQGPVPAHRGPEPASWR
jgi:hypothetical protein